MTSTSGEQIRTNDSQRWPVPARELYAGRAYHRSLGAVDRFVEQRPDLPSRAAHRLSRLRTSWTQIELLVPYEAVMGSGVRQWRERGRFLGMPEQARSLVESCELTIFALSQPYSTGAALATLDPTHGYGVVIGVGPTPTIAPIAIRRREPFAGSGLRHHGA